MSKSHTDPPKAQDQRDDLDRRPLRDALKTPQANTDEMEALSLTNQCLLRDLEERTTQMQRPKEEQQRHDAPQDADREGKTSQAKEHDPYKPSGEDRNEGIPGRNNRGNGPILYQQEIRERS